MILRAAPVKVKRGFLSFDKFAMLVSRSRGAAQRSRWTTSICRRTGRAEGEASPNADPAALDAAAVIEQVRELLFGEHRRATETVVEGARRPASRR